MAAKKVILVDTDILIKVFRGDVTRKKHLDALRGRIAVSIITVLELYQGAVTKQRKYELEKQLRAYFILHIEGEISKKALMISKKYFPVRQILPPDCLIASTAICHHLELYTDNKSDFDFIKELKLYVP